MARKADKATAPVAKIANKTLKLLCMISIQVRFQSPVSKMSFVQSLLVSRQATLILLA
jgi:hypothetical protein